MAKGNTDNDRQLSRNVILPLEILLLVSGGFGLAVSSPVLTVWMLAVWVALALGYVVIAIRRVMRAVRSPDVNRQMLPDDHAETGPWRKRFHIDISVIGFASAMGLISAFAVSIGTIEGHYAAFARVLAPLGIVLAWMLLHLGFCRLYANNWAREEGDGGLTFPGTDEPGLVEFTYFAFCVGSSLQSPIVTTSRMRMLVAVHTVISFLYGTVLIGFIVSTLPSG